MTGNAERTRRLALGLSSEKRPEETTSAKVSQENRPTRPAARGSRLREYLPSLSAAFLGVALIVYPLVTGEEPRPARDLEQFRSRLTPVRAPSDESRPSGGSAPAAAPGHGSGASFHFAPERMEYKTNNVRILLFKPISHRSPGRYAPVPCERVGSSMVQVISGVGQRAKQVVPRVRRK
jgi:hypothetical protein